MVSSPVRAVAMFPPEAMPILMGKPHGWAAMVAQVSDEWKSESARAPNESSSKEHPPKPEIPNDDQSTINKFPS
eukprot:561934-Amphidinium_carterae.1